MQSIEDFAQAHGITVADWHTHGFHADEDGWEHQRWTFELSFEGRTLEVPFRTGMGIEDTPGVTDILDALASDAATYENSRGFEDWAGDLGYDTDSRKAEATYRLVEEQTEKLRTFMGNAYEGLVWDTERL